jgi:hypothetical protein
MENRASPKRVEFLSFLQVFREFFEINSTKYVANATLDNVCC